MISSASFGMLFGAVFLCTIDDSIERRKAIAICIPLFSFYATAGRINDLCLFSALRFLAGLRIGGILATLVDKGLIEAYGWSSVFLAAGLPVVMIPFMLKSMPESMPVLMKQDGWQN